MATLRLPVALDPARLLSRAVDGLFPLYEVCADFVVERHGERGIVEVKTGSVARPSAPETRRQIFEYASLYGVDKVYMFDGDRSRLHEITFGTPPHATSRRQRLVEWQIGFACGVGVAGLIVVAWRMLTLGR